MSTALRTTPVSAARLAADTEMLVVTVDQGTRAYPKQAVLEREVLNDIVAGQPLVEARLLATLGDLFAQLGELGRARALAEEGLELRLAAGAEERVLAQSWVYLAEIERILSAEVSEPPPFVLPGQAAAASMEQTS